MRLSLLVKPGFAQTGNVRFGGIQVEFKVAKFVS
jgi:hypothetical protein